MLRTATSPREALLSALRRESGRSVPFDIALCPAQRTLFTAEFGTDDYAEVWGVPHRRLAAPFEQRAVDFGPWHEALPDGTRVDAWGIGHAPSRDGSHFTRLVHPLRAARRVEDIASYPMPSAMGPAATAELGERVRALHERGLAAVVSVAPVGGTVFWPAYKLRGMENLLCDLHLAPDLARCLLDRVTRLTTVQAERAASTGADILHLADDLGTQHSTYVSPEMFRSWIKPRLATVIRAAKHAKPDILVHFHSDGAVFPFIPDFIEIGVDVLNPIQPECMDPLRVKHEYGDRLSLSGCIGTQTTMPYGSPSDVRDAVRMACDRLGRDGGLWLAPTHLVEPEVPWDNVLAFVETAREYAVATTVRRTT